MVASIILKSLGVINYFAVNCFGSQMIASTHFCELILEASLQTNSIIDSDEKDVIKKQPDNAPKCKDDEKTQMTQIIGLIGAMST